MKSLPFVPKVVKATEQRLNAIYAGAYAGLKGERLAAVAGLSLQQYQQLCELDPIAKEHELRARVDSELEHSSHLAAASRGGDAKASLAILQHQHGWTAKQEISINHNYSILQALEEAQGRLIEHDAESAA